MPTSLPSVEQIARLPNVLGVVRLHETDGTMDQTGAEAEALGNILACFTQLATLVGGSFGLEGLEEAQMSGKTLGILCLPEGESTLGLVLHSRARTSEITARIRDGLLPA